MYFSSTLDGKKKMSQCIIQLLQNMKKKSSKDHTCPPLKHRHEFPNIRGMSKGV